MNRGAGGRLATLLVAVFALLAAPGLVRETFVAVRDAARFAGESELEARRRHWPEYAEGIEEIRRALPRDAEYLLAEGKGTAGMFWVQCDLAPRRAWSFGEWYLDVESLRRIGRPPGAPAHVVVSYGLLARPHLVASEDFFAGRAP